MHANYPSPSRGAAPPGPASGAVLLALLLGAPVAWMADLLAAYLGASASCPLQQTATGTALALTAPWLLAATIGAFAVAAGCAWLAVRNWRAVATGTSTRDADNASFDAARFLARCALLISVSFCLAIVPLFVILLAPLCPA
jgi:hypothetical protein